MSEAEHNTWINRFKLLKAEPGSLPEYINVIATELQVTTKFTYILFDPSAIFKNF